jgi:hypothetical protein
VKVKCIRLLDANGREVEASSWLMLDRTYHVMAIHVAPDGKRSYSIISRQPEGEWPQMGSHLAECFDIVSEVVPSNWREWVYGNASGTSPVTWQEPGFYEAFYDHDTAAYPIFERERDIILSEDP